MEKLKAIIPDNLKQIIYGSTSNTVSFACSALLEFLLATPQFQQVISDLTDPELALCCKSREKALDFKKNGNEAFLKGDYVSALKLYTQGLKYSPMTDGEKDGNFVATLFVNRAFTMHKMGLLEECRRDCDRAIEFSPTYAKAWYRRGKAFASLRKFESAIRDLQISLIMEGSSSGKRQIQDELDEISTLSNAADQTHPTTDDEHIKFVGIDEQCYTKLQCVMTLNKGRGMVSTTDIPPSSLIHREEPIAAKREVTLKNSENNVLNASIKCNNVAIFLRRIEDQIVLKSYRETHCHFCFNELPADVLFCTSCTIPFYCSQHCQEVASGKMFSHNPDLNNLDKILPVNLYGHFMYSTNLGKRAKSYSGPENIPEHRHECGGVHWPAILPPDVVLAGRVMVQYIEKGKQRNDICKYNKTMELACNYDEIPAENRLELYLYAIVLSYCLQHDYSLTFPDIYSLSSELVPLITKIKINSMAVVRMKSLNRKEECENYSRFDSGGTAFTSRIEQVQVGKAIYADGSLFNHSCQPNIQAYFISRTLFLRSTEFVSALDPLELSYGPQLGELSFHERQELLKERYSFKCQCRGCIELNLSDIVIDAFKCHASNCLGAVLEERHFKHIREATRESNASVSYTTSLARKKDIKNVACMLLQKNGNIYKSPGHCLTCGSHNDIDSMKKTSETALMDIRKLKDTRSSNNTETLVSSKLRSLNSLRSVRHPYSKIVALAEDTLAEAFVCTGEINTAVQHCKESIKILEKLYGTDHIVIAHELLKLVSIQLSLGDATSSGCNIKKLWTIFELYYGSHATVIFPYLKNLGTLVNINQR